MNPPCSHCPIAGPCPAFTATCAAIRDNPARRTVFLELAARHSGAVPADPPPSVAETVIQLAIAKACPFRSTHPPCGCSGSRCGLRRGAIVGHADCLDCVRRFG